MMRRWRWGVFGVVALGVGGMGVWAGARLKDGFDPGAVAVTAPDKEAVAGPPPQDPVPTPDTPPIKTDGPIEPSTKEEPTPAPIAMPPSPPPEPLKDQGAKAPPSADPPPSDVKSVPAVPSPPSPMPADLTTAPKSPSSPLVGASTPPAPPPSAPIPAPAATPKPSQPDFSSLVPPMGTDRTSAPPPAPPPVPPLPATAAAPPSPPASVAPAKFEAPSERARIGSPVPSVPGPEENAKPNNIFRALPGAAEAAPAPVPTNSPWTVQIKVVQGRTELEAHNGDKVHLRITCKQMQVQAPNGNIQAQGDVKLSGSDLNGSCDLLTIIWQKEDVLMEGKVHLKCPKDSQEIDLAADRLSVKLTDAKTAKAVDRKESSDILRAWTDLLPVPQTKAKP